jgi:hypothetical protein
MMANGDHHDPLQLPPLPCPVCGNLLLPQPVQPDAANDWQFYLRRCDNDQLCYSDAFHNPTLIYGPPQDRNLPEQIRDGAHATLDQALNVWNRPRKTNLFGYSTSEDALTWTLFKFLNDSGRLTRVLQRAGLPIPDDVSRHEALLLWGVPMPLDRHTNPSGWALRTSLENLSDGLGEDPASRTEPDVLIDFGGHGVFIIEVKHRSGTDLKKLEYAGWDRYYPATSPPSYAASMRASECYELARNWKFGLELTAATPRSFTLAYLGPDSLFRGGGARVLRPFEDCLPTEGLARLQKIGWNTLLGAITDPPEWIVRHFEAKGYSFAKGR